MKHFIKPALLFAGFVPAVASAQVEVDRTKYPDYNPGINPDYSLLENSVVGKYALKGNDANQLPDHVNNAELKFFPPVFNQDGGSCGSASRICYMFTHELNAYRNLDAKSLSNRYPSHFVWLLTNGNSGKDEFVQFVGVPSAEVYGGTTYSALFGNQDTSNEDFGWMQGYDKWYSAMWNRMLRPSHFPMNVGTPEGREAVKRWLYNHNGDTSFHGGGIVGIGVASGGDWKPIPQSPTNDEIGVTGMKYVNKWGTQVDHALTIVGYDDRIEFDLNKNGIKGEESANEKGAWIIVNSWGNGWCNKGFVYCPYAYAGSAFRKDGTFNNDYWSPEIYKVRKDYRPLRTIKVEMDYSRRSEICLSAGISTDLNAEMPEKTLTFDHFKYAGDGKNGNANPAPEIPMLGRWADGKLHDEPMEFGYDLTDLSASYDKNMPLKYFFIIETRQWAEGKGKIHHASIIDYEHDHDGVETPFNINAEGVQVLNKGNKTIISTIVYGESFYAPQNLSLEGSALKWDAPTRSGHKVEGYTVYRDGVTLAEVPADQLTYQLTEEVPNATYSVVARYENDIKSAKVNVTTPVAVPPVNQVTDFKHSGFSIPNIFSTKYEEATIEFWIKPNSLRDWNQSAGPGWGTFMFHANGNGSFTAGWNTGGHRIDTGAGKLAVGRWTHVAITVKKNTMKVFINGIQSGSVTSNQYSGIGGFGNLVFNPNGDGNNTDARIDEIRIWNYAKEQNELLVNRMTEYAGNVLPNGLLAYYKGDVMEVEGKSMLRDCVNGNHAEILNKNFNQTVDVGVKYNTSGEKMEVSIVQPAGSVFAGIPAKFNATYSNSVSNLVWDAPGAKVEKLQAATPFLTFEKAGEQTITVTGSNSKGETVTATSKINVSAAPAPDATFAPNKSKISAGERVTFLVKQPMVGYIYKWEMPGADVESSNSTNAATSYPEKGEYTVTLHVTAPDGKEATSTQKVAVVEVAPATDFDVAPAVVLKGETTFLKDKSKFSPTSWQWLLHNINKDIIINGQNSSFTPEVPGVYDVTLTTKNATGTSKKTRKRALIVCNADSKNGLNFSYDKAQVTLAKVPFKSNDRLLTMDWWMKPASLSAICCGIGDGKQLSLKTTTDGSTTLFIKNHKVGTPSGYVIANEWHHYAVAFGNGKVYFYRDGELIHQENAGTSTLPNVEAFHIGLEDAPVNGQIDEFRIWNRNLDAEKLLSYANAPIADVAAAEKEGLVLYYDFNQSGGAVKDLTSQQNNGTRTNFGPEGDAWGLSKGVFSLNTDAKSQSQDVTATYLKNYKKAFKCDGTKVVNPNGGIRFAAIADWTLENADTTSNGIVTSVHVDKQKESCFTYTATWDGFSSLTNHKAYQTMKLPAGSYTFIAKYGNFEGNCGSSYLVASAGKGLPETSSLDQAIGAEAMQNKSGSTMSNSLQFVLAEETEVSLGLLINLGGQSCCTISEFQLLRNDVEYHEADNANGYDLTVDGTGYNSLCLPYPTLVPEGATAYVAKSMENDQVVLEPIADGIVPAKTGVIIAAEAGKYHFEPSATSSNISSLLIGVLENTDTDNSKRYFTFDALSTPGFYLFNGSTLEANRAYLVTDASDTHTSYSVNIVPAGIDQITNGAADSKTYDLSGRRVKEPVKGLYISNGKKILVK